MVGATHATEVAVEEGVVGHETKLRTHLIAIDFDEGLSLERLDERFFPTHRFDTGRVGFFFKRSPLLASHLAGIRAEDVTEIIVLGVGLLGEA
jgi:hypothetical protein